MDKLAFQSRYGAKGSLCSSQQKSPSDAPLRGSTPAHIAKQNGQNTQNPILQAPSTRNQVVSSTTTPITPPLDGTVALGYCRSKWLLNDPAHRE